MYMIRRIDVGVVSPNTQIWGCQICEVIPISDPPRMWRSYQYSIRLLKVSYSSNRSRAIEFMLIHNYPRIVKMTPSVNFLYQYYQSLFELLKIDNCGYHNLVRSLLFVKLEITICGVIYLINFATHYPSFVEIMEDPRYPNILD
jgi:hypothetical protein